MACWRNTPEKTPGCDWVTPPTETELGRVVGDDYAFKAEFNSLHRHDKKAL